MSFINAAAGLRGFNASMDRGRRERFEDEDRAAIREDRTMRKAEYERNSQLAGLQQEIAIRKADELRRADANEKIYEDKYFNPDAASLPPRTVSVTDTVNRNSVGLSGGIGGREVQTVSRDIASAPTVSRIDRIDSVMNAAKGQKDYKKYQELEALKPKMMEEGMVQALKVKIRGGNAQEIAATMNEYGSHRVVPETAKIDAEGILTGIDANTGRPLPALNLTELETFFHKELGREKKEPIKLGAGDVLLSADGKRRLAENKKIEEANYDTFQNEEGTFSYDKKKGPGSAIRIGGPKENSAARKQSQEMLQGYLADSIAQLPEAERSKYGALDETDPAKPFRVKPEISQHASELAKLNPELANNPAGLADIARRTVYPGTRERPNQLVGADGIKYAIYRDDQGNEVQRYPMGKAPAKAALAQPAAQDVAGLLARAGDPKAVAFFDRQFGKGAAARVLQGNKETPRAPSAALAARPSPVASANAAPLPSNAGAGLAPRNVNSIEGLKAKFAREQEGATIRNGIDQLTQAGNRPELTPEQRLQISQRIQELQQQLELLGQ